MNNVSSLVLFTIPTYIVISAVSVLAQSCNMELGNGKVTDLESSYESKDNQPLLPATPPALATTTAPTPECSARLAEQAEPITPPVPLPSTWRDPNTEDVLPQQLDPSKPYPTPGDRFILFLSEQESSYWAWNGSSWYLWGYDNENLSPSQEGVFLMQNVCTGVLSF